MSDKLPRISGKKCVKTLAKVGWYVRSQKGSHIVLKHDNFSNLITVPDHKELAIGTLRAIIRGAGLTVEEFNKLI